MLRFSLDFAKKLRRAAAGGATILTRSAAPLYLLAATAPAFMLAAVTALYLNFGNVIAHRDRADRATDALFHVGTLVSALQDAETGERGFLLTGEDSYLEPYEHAMAVLPKEMVAIAAFAKSGIRQQQVAAIEELARDKLALLRRNIEVRRGRGLDASASLIQLGEGKRLMDAIRAESASLEEEIRREMAEEHQRSVHRMLITEGAVAGFGTLAVLMLALVAGGRSRTIRRQALSIEQLSVAKAAAEFDRRSMGVLLDALPVGVFVTDTGGRILRANAEAGRIWGGPLRTSDIAGYRDLRAWWARDGRPIAPDDWAVARALRTGEISVGEVIHIHRFDGSRGTILNSAAPVRDAQGLVLGAIAVLQDITEQQRAEEALRQAQKLEAVGQLTSGIAHDFNNYLTVISGTFERLEPACGDRPKASHLILQGKAAATRAERLVRQLLGFSGRRALQPQALDCNKVVSELQELLRRALPNGIELLMILDPALWPAFTDRDQLETALLNLVVNARDAIAEGRGRIIIETAKLMLDPAAGRAKSLAPGDYVRISVADTGRGMPPSVLAHVFEPFYTTKSAGKGSGLGLSQIYGFAKQSDGTVEIDTSEGAGTTVRLLLPRSMPRAASSP